MTQSTSDIYSAADIEANRAGRLTDNQRRYLKADARSFSKGMLGGALIAAVIGALIATSNGPTQYPFERQAFAAVFFLGAVVLLLVGIRPNPEAGDASSGRVEAVEGAIGKRSYSSSTRGATSTSYFLEIGEKRYSVGGAEYHAAPDSGWVRLYMTPRTHKVVNFERLPDKVVPDMASVTPAALMKELGSAFLSHDQQTRNETRAEMEAMARSVKAQMTVTDTPASAAAGGRSRPAAAGSGHPGHLADGPDVGDLHAGRDHGGHRHG